MGSLLDFDPMDPAQYQVSDEERKRLMLTNLLLGAGAGLSGARRGSELGGLSYGLAGGAASAQQALGDAQAAKWNKLKAAGMAMDYSQKKDAYQQEQGARQAEREYQPQGMSDMSPTPQNAAALAQQSGPYAQLMQRAVYMDSKGYPQQAEKYREQALKFAPQYDGTETVMGPDGPTLMQKYKNQAPSAIQGFQPKPDITMQDLGGSVQAIDKLRTQGGQTFNKSATPGEVMSNALGLKNYGLSAAHLKLAQDKANQEKTEQFGTPIQITGADGSTQLMIPRKGTSELVPMTDAQGQPVTKSASIPQSYKDKAYSLSNLRDAITDYHETIKNLTPADYFKPQKMAEVQAKYGRSQMGLKNLFELGVIAGPDMSILAQNLTDPTSLRGISGKMSGGLEAQNKVIFNMLDSADKNLASAYNQRPRNAQPKSSGAANMSDEELRKALGL